MKLLQKLKVRVKQIKSQLAVLVIAYQDSRTPLLPKFIIGLTVAYLLSPVDLIPDFIPVLGLLDDLLLVPLLISLSIKLIPAKVLQEARQQLTDNPISIQKNNWVAGIFIILIWLLLLFYVLRIIFH